MREKSKNEQRVPNANDNDGFEMSLDGTANVILSQLTVYGL